MVSKRSPTVTLESMEKIMIEGELDMLRRQCPATFRELEAACRNGVRLSADTVGFLTAMGLMTGGRLHATAFRLLTGDESPDRGRA